ncbi:MAG: 50S ribosomal protein L29 [Candidatus Dojkabacteria bacterium]
MKAKDLRKLTKEELEKRLQEKQIEMVELNLELKTGQETNYAVRRKRRKELARIITVLHAGDFGKGVKLKAKKSMVKQPKDSNKSVKSGKITKPQAKTKKGSKKKGSKKKVDKK